jgi:hypothetical protein
MGLFSKLFGKKSNSQNVRQRPNQPDVIGVETADEKMNWAIEKAKLTRSMLPM